MRWAKKNEEEIKRSNIRRRSKGLAPARWFARFMQLCLQVLGASEQLKVDWATLELIILFCKEEEV
jgi:hypothetical protein